MHKNQQKVAYKTIALSFGGVRDEEGKQHAMRSLFFADLHQFDMVRRCVCCKIDACLSICMCMYSSLCIHVFPPTV